MRILAIDLGTSSLKFMRLDEHGHALSIDRVPMSGLSVERWISALQQNLQEHGDGREIGGIAITGQMHGLLTREHGFEWGDGIPWDDDRSVPIIPHLREAIGPDAVTTTGGLLAAGFLGASLAWVRQHEPARWRRITSVHLPKDALINELTGEHVTDPSDAAGTGLYAPSKGDWAWSVVDALGVPRTWLPRVMSSGSIAGGLRPEYASLLALPRGLPIIVAGGDAPTGAYGVGVTRDTDALVMLSTGAQVIMPSRVWEPDLECRWYTWPSVAPEKSGFAPYLRVGTLLNAGNVTSWAERAFADGAMSDQPTRLIALPHLTGTRVNPTLRGAVFGLDERTTAGEIQRALIEGVAFSVRATMETMTGAGALPSRIRLGGGLAHRTEIRQLFSDVLGQPLQPVSQPEVTAYGAGLLALHNLTGLLLDESISGGETTHPTAGAVYDARYALYRELDRAMTPLAGRLAAVEHDEA